RPECSRDAEVSPRPLVERLLHLLEVHRRFIHVRRGGKYSGAELAGPRGRARTVELRSPPFFRSERRGHLSDRFRPFALRPGQLDRPFVEGLAAQRLAHGADWHAANRARTWELG